MTAPHRRFLVAALLLLPSLTPAQDDYLTRTSPLAMATWRYQDGYVKVVYGQPRRRGREIFGTLVPYGKVWRTGANESTEITLTKNVRVAGKPLAAGTYSLYSIPERDAWTLIFNKDLGMWGSYNYNEKMDALRVEVPTRIQGNLIEEFTIRFETRNQLADLVLMWDHIVIRVPMEMETITN